MNYSKFVVLGLSGFLFGGGLAYAAKKDSPTKMTELPLPEQPQFLYPLEGDFKTAVQKLGRTVADTGKNSFGSPVDVTDSAIESKLSNDFKRIRDEILGDTKKGISGIQTKEQLDLFIKKYSGASNSEGRKNFNALDESAQFVVLQLKALAPMKSFFFRAKTYVDKNSITRTMIVSILRAQAVGIQNFAQQNGAFNPPGVANSSKNIWEAAFAYMTEPFPDMGSQINSDAGLELFLNSLLHSGVSIWNDYLAIVSEAQKGKSFWWDNKLLLSYANIVDPKDRYILLGGAEHLAIASGLNLALSTLYTTTSYGFDGFQDSIAKVGTLMGYDVSVAQKNGAEGLTSKNRFTILKNKKSLFKRRDDFKSRMGTAYDCLRQAVFFARDSYNEVLKRQPDDQHLFDVRFAQSLNRVALKSIGNLISLFDPPIMKADGNKYNVNSTIVNGEVIYVDLKGFYNNPPAHLSELYPVRWNDRSRGVQPGTEVQAWGKSDILRNYKYESAYAWSYDGYKTLFPHIKSDEKDPKLTTEVGDYARVLGQTWGASAFAIPLSAFVF